MFSFSGYPGSAWDYWVKSGIVSGGPYNSHQGCIPYLIERDYMHETPACIKECEPGYDVAYADDKHFGQTAYAISNDDVQIRGEIFENGPVEADFVVYEDFMNYESGVYQHTTGDKLGSHAVRILGWGIEDYTPYWLIANSWGPSWYALRLIFLNKNCFQFLFQGNEWLC